MYWSHKQNPWSNPIIDMYHLSAAIPVIEVELNFYFSTIKKIDFQSNICLGLGKGKNLLLTFFNVAGDPGWKTTHQGITVILAPAGCLTKTPSSSNSHKIMQKLPIANKRDNLTPLSPYMFGSACNYRLWRVQFLSYAYHVMPLKHYKFSSYRVPP